MSEISKCSRNTLKSSWCWDGFSFWFKNIALVRCNLKFYFRVTFNSLFYAFRNKLRLKSIIVLYRQRSSIFVRFFRAYMIVHETSHAISFYLLIPSEFALSLKYFRFVCRYRPFRESWVKRRCRHCLWRAAANCASRSRIVLISEGSLTCKNILWHGGISFLASPIIPDIHTTCLNDLCLLLTGFEHPNFCMRGERSEKINSAIADLIFRKKKDFWNCLVCVPIHSLLWFFLFFFVS